MPNQTDTLSRTTPPRPNYKTRPSYSKKRPPASGRSKLLEDYLHRPEFAAEIDACERTVARMQQQGLPFTVIAGKHYIHKTRGLEWLIERGTAA